MPGNKPIFNADAAEEYFTMLCTFYHDTANDIFNRDNEGRHASDHVWSAEYQKYIGMQIAMREVLEYFSKFELVTDQEIVTNADRIRVMSDEDLAETLNSSVCPPHNKCNTRQHCLKCWIDWLKQPTED